MAFIPIECRFCHKPVLYDEDTNRVVELDRIIKHTSNCEARREHFKRLAQERAEEKRQQRRI